MKNQIINNYYKVQWNINKRQRMFSIILLIFFNAIEWLYILMGKNKFELVCVYFIFAFVIGLMLWLSYKVPCVRWNIGWKRESTIVDISERQTKFNIVINYICIVMIVLAVVLNQSINSTVFKG